MAIVPKRKRRSYEGPEPKPQTGRKETSKIYHSSRWRKLRLVKLKMNPFCEIHEKKGEQILAKVVDHKKRVRAGGDPFDLNNLQSVCHKCHNQKSGEESHDKYSWRNRGNYKSKGRQK